MSKKQIFYIAFFTVLVIGFFITLSFVVPEFVRPKINPISNVQPFSFINQDGRTVTEKDLKGKVVAVNFFFTTCRGVCPRMSNNLRPVYEAYKNDPDFLILSHTCDPGRDSVPVIKRYADSMKVDTRKWVFLTGEKDSLYMAARHSYRIDDPANYVQNMESDFLHTQFIALVNKKGEVVSIHDGIKPSEIKDMKKRIEKLLKD